MKFLKIFLKNDYYEFNDVNFGYFNYKEKDQINQQKLEEPKQKLRVYISPPLKREEYWDYKDFLNSIGLFANLIRAIHIPYHLDSGKFVDTFFISGDKLEEIEKRKSFVSIKYENLYVIGKYDYTPEESTRYRMGSNFTDKKRYWMSTKAI